MNLDLANYVPLENIADIEYYAWVHNSNHHWLQNHRGKYKLLQQ